MKEELKLFGRVLICLPLSTNGWLVLRVYLKM
jgi:hypothetical protein